MRPPARAGRRADRELVDTRRAGGHSAHDKRRGVRGAPARDVGGGAAHRHFAHLDPLAVTRLHDGRVAQLCLRDQLDVLDCLSKPLQHVGIQDRDRVVDLARGHGQLLLEQLGVVEARGELPDGLVPTRADLGDDRRHVLRQAGGRRCERAELGSARATVEALDSHDRSLMRVTSASISAAFSLWATGLAISRAVHSQISSWATSPFSSSVLPVAVRSTIPSTRPVSGADLDRSLHLDDLGLAPGVGEVFGGDAWVLGGDPDRPRRRSGSASDSAPSGEATTIRQRP